MKWNLALGRFHKQEPWFLEKAAMEEYSGELGNPSVGWYQIITFPLDQQWDREDVASSLRDSEQLVFAMIDIGAYRCRELDDAALNNLRSILEFFRNRGKELILRLTYDTVGKGMEHEPTRFDQVQRHILQLTGVLRSFAQSIFIIQGILVGSWGEMHSSRHLTKGKIVALMDMLDSRMGEGVFLCVRKPSHYRMLRKEESWNMQKENRIGLFNDAVFASETDMGTYGVLTRAEAGWEQSWTAREELSFQETLCRTVPNGGEVICPAENPLSLEQTVDRLRKMHVSYLNIKYDRKLLEQWERQLWRQPGVWQGMNGLDYIGRHLGYRFRILNVDAGRNRRNGKVTISVKLENVGFSSCYFPVMLTVFQKHATGEIRTHSITLPACTPGSGEESTVRFEIEPSASVLFLKMTRVSDGRRIFFGMTGETEAEGLSIGVLKKEQ